MTIEQSLQLARQYHQAGRLAEAEGIYREILAADPNCDAALHRLGLVAGQVGQTEAAVQLISRAISINPGTAEYYANLGEMQRRLGRLDEAIESLRAAVNIRGDLAVGWNNLAMALRQAGKFDEAIEASRSAVRLKPDYAEAYDTLGVSLREKGEVDEAIEAGFKAVQFKADFPEAMNNLGVALRYKGRLDEAVSVLNESIRLKGDAPESRYNLGLALGEAGRFAEAVEAIRRAITISPAVAEMHKDLALALSHLGNFEESVAEYERAIQLKPDFADAHNNLGSVYRTQGELARAMQCFRRAVEIDPKFVGPHSNLILTMHLDPESAPVPIFEELRRWDRTHTDPLKGSIRPHERSDRKSAPVPLLAGGAERRLRIGYLSPDFRRHSVAYFILPVLESHDRVKVQVFGYSAGLQTDEVTGRIRAACEEWREVTRVPDEATAEMIRRDGIDILIDLAGHTFMNRLGVLARKPAPVQATYLGFPNSTGMEAIDWRVTDELADPEGAEKYYVEELMRLPRTAWCFCPLLGGPPVETGRGGRMVFGSFNDIGKVNRPLLGLWARILKEVPDSVLVLKSPYRITDAAAERMRKALGDFGVAGERLELLAPRRSGEDHLLCYGELDIALDTYPYHGTTTTCEAMWMGVPVITLAGTTHVSRVGVSLLSSVGLTELIAEKEEEYIRRAVRLAGDRSRLKEMRLTLRDRMKGSPLMDGAGLARALEAGYREMWEAWIGQ